MGWQEAFLCGSYLYMGLMLSSICVLKVQAQSQAGFISIDCGSASYSDKITKLFWESDSNYTATGLNGEVPFPVNSTLDNADALQTFRYFPGNRSKYCYELQLTTSNISVLIRAMFLHGSAPELTLPITFNASVNGTPWFQLSYGVDDSYDVLTTSVEYEGVFFSPGSLIHFCLVPQTGAPFISSLELRQFTADNEMYSFPGSTEVYLSNVWRYNCGAQIGAPTIRYPDDQFDRMWKAPGAWASGLISASHSGTASTNSFSDANNVPPAVMQTAWLNDNANSSFWFSLALATSITKVYACVYFEEIEPTVDHASTRIFDIDLNGYTVYDQFAFTFSLVRWFSNWTVLDLETNFTFTATSDSTLGPIVNAVEVYAPHEFDYSTTAAQDVTSLAALQVSFNLTDWQGDPCLPVPWNWVKCTADTPARVDILLLSSMGIHAPIPPALSDLSALTEIYLDNNSLYGTIPDSLASLPNLTLLYLDDNDLSGEVPPDVLSELGSNFHYYGNSLLGAPSPSGSPGSPGSSATKKSSSIGIIIGAIVGGIVVVLVLVCLVTWVYCCSKKNKRQQKFLPNEIAIPEMKIIGRTAPLGQVKPQSPSEDGLAPHPPLIKPPTEVGRVSYEEVQIATKNFKTKLGQGSFGSVFHGWINDREVAVKLNSIQSQQGRNEFITEVEILTRVHHRNLVSLIGYCDEGEELILIYEFEVNGTLTEWLCDNEKARGTLDWERRLQIAADGAKGLEYLHKGCDPTIIHRDVKSSNILLDESLTAKVADFGLSKSALTENTTGFSTGVKGTPGYLDPEYHQMGKLTHKSDVYSYGVVLAELITGRPPFKIESGSPSIILVDYLRKMVETNDIETLADPNLRGLFNPESMWRMADLALSCVDLVGVRRPDFTQVVNGINEAIEMEKTFTMHSPLAQHGSFIATSGNLHRYQNLP